MHDTAYSIGGLVIKAYCNGPGASILEIGSQSINGSLRDHVGPDTKYIGVDIEDGPGVDIVQELGAAIPVDDSTFDLVIASSVFEHDAAFWGTFLEMCRKVKDGGFLYINVPSNGAVHRYPIDAWRFYPDAGVALADWARRQGQPVVLVESFMAEREADLWNDFIAVFRKGHDTSGLPDALTYEQVRSVNIMTWKSEKLLRPRDVTEDQLLLKQSEEMQGKLATSLNEQAIGIDGLRNDLTQASGALGALQDELARARTRSEELAASNGGLHAQIAQLRIDHDEILRREAGHHGRLQELDAARERLSREVGESLGQIRQLTDERAHHLARTQEAEAARTTLSQDLAEALTRVQQLEAEGAKSRTQLQEVEALHEKLAKDMDEAAARAHERDLDHEREVGELNQKIAESAQNGSVQSELDELREKYDELERLAYSRLQEVVTLTNYLRNRDEEIVRSKHQEAWLRNVLKVVDRKPSGMGILLPAKARQDIYRRLESDHLFSGDKYLNRYPDVAQSGMDPLRHYIRHGIAEGRKL